jgi:predicted RNA binding protein YcfA (HicA-like mRNA interferase family)
MSRFRPVPRQKWEKFLRGVGCEKSRQKSSHIFYRKPGLKRPIVFQADKEVAPHIIKTNLETLGISFADFLKALKQI